jgi:hypothetical protein
LARQIVVEIIGDNRKFTGAVDGSTSKLGGFKSVLAGVGAGIGFGGITAGISTITNFLGDATTNASNLQQSVGAVESVFGNASGILEKFGKTAAESFGLSKREVNEFGSVLGAQLQGMGFDADEAANTVVNLQQRAADMAATFGGSTADAVTAISSLMRGERDPIEKYGVSLKQADINAELAARGLDGLTGEAKKQAEAQVALDLLMQQTNKTQGQFAKESDSAAGAQARANAKFENASAQLGSVLLPIMTAFFNFLSGTAIPILIQVAEFIAPIIGLLINIGSTIFDIAGKVGRAVGDIIGFFTGLPGKIGRAVSGMWDGIWTGFKSVLNTLIRAWNSLRFKVPSVDLGPLGKIGGFTIGVPSIPTFHTGGIVPGPRGADVLAVLQAGERVIPANQANGGPSVVINIESFTGSDRDIEQFADRLAMRLRLAGV